jgi:hypothetical protein
MYKHIVTITKPYKKMQGSYCNNNDGNLSGYG